MYLSGLFVPKTNINHCPSLVSAMIMCSTRMPDCVPVYVCACVFTSKSWSHCKVVLLDPQQLFTFYQQRLCAVLPLQLVVNTSADTHAHICLDLATD